MSLNNSKRRYTRDLKSFANRVLAKGQANRFVYVFGRTNKAFLLDLHRRGVDLSDFAAITDKTILRYRTHPKKKKGAVVSSHRFCVVEAAVKKPKNVL